MRSRRVVFRRVARRVVCRRAVAVELRLRVFEVRTRFQTHILIRMRSIKFFHVFLCRSFDDLCSTSSAAGSMVMALKFRQLSHNSSSAHKQDIYTHFCFLLYLLYPSIALAPRNESAVRFFEVHGADGTPFALRDFRRFNVIGSLFVL